MQRFLGFVLALLLGAGSAGAASQINGLPQIPVFPLSDPGCPAASTENLWITRGNAIGNDYRITPTQAGYIYQGIAAPACPFRYQYWWNTATNPPQLEVFDGSVWLIAGALNPSTHVWSLPNPTLSGTVLGTYTLAGSPTIVSPAISNPVFSGVATGTYTLAGTVSITSPAISNPTITGTVTGTAVIPLTALATIPAHTLLGNATGSTAAVTSTYTASGTGSTVATTANSFTAGDITVSDDTSGTVRSSGTYGATIYYRYPNAGATDSLQILNSGATAGTASQVSLVTGTAGTTANSTLTDGGSGVTRQWGMTVGAAVGGGIKIDSSGGGAGAAVALVGGATADGITMSGTSEVLYSYTTGGATAQLRAFNNSSTANTIASLMTQTGTGGATAALQMVDGATPTGRIITGAGATGGISLITAAGPIWLLPTSAAVPQALLSVTNAGAETRFQVLNNSSAASTVASLYAVTGTASSYGALTVTDGATPAVVVQSGSGVTGGLNLNSLAGTVKITPATSVAATAPQIVAQFNKAGGAGSLQVLNNSTSASTTSAVTIATGTVASSMDLTVAETAHVATITLNAGVIGGLTVSSAGGGAVSDLTFASGRNFILTGLLTDATHTDATVCRDTTSGALFFGSGAAGICLGTSSLRFKTNVATLAPGLDEVMGVRAIAYTYKPGYGGEGVKYGFAAEEVEPVLPELVGHDPEGRANTVDWAGMVPVLWHAVQQQQRRIADLEDALVRR